MSLPPLPEWIDYDSSYVYDIHGDAVPFSETMKAYGAACREAALEEAAVKCIELMKQYRFDKHTHEGLGDIRLTIGAQEEIAAAIRALKNA